MDRVIAGPRVSAAWAAASGDHEGTGDIVTPTEGQTQPVGLGRPPYLVIGFIGPVIHSLNMAF